MDASFILSPSTLSLLTADWYAKALKGVVATIVNSAYFDPALGVTLLFL